MTANSTRLSVKVQFTNAMPLKIYPCSLSQANDLVSRLHRHHKPVTGHRFSLAAVLVERQIDGSLRSQVVGACIVGRPVARGLDPYLTAEVTRLVTDGTKNACSLLYSAAARVAREMGFREIQTYILSTEPGTSLIASGWRRGQETPPKDWNQSRDRPLAGPPLARTCFWKSLNEREPIPGL